MKLSLIVGIIATTCATLALADKASKVTIMQADVKTMDHVHFIRESDPVVHNEDGKIALEIFFVIRKEIPSDASFVVDVGQSSTSNGTYKTIHSYTVKNFCTNKKDPYYQYLPDFKYGSKCWTEGAYGSPDFVLFPFYNLLSDAELKSPWFLVNGKIVSGSKTLFELELKYKSNN